MFKIVYSKKALRFLKKQDKPTQKRIVDAISGLPLSRDIKKLQGTFALTNAEAVAPEADELAALNARKSGDAEYQPTMTHEELLKELGL